MLVALPGKKFRVLSAAGPTLKLSQVNIIALSNALNMPRPSSLPLHLYYMAESSLIDDI